MSNEKGLSIRFIRNFTIEPVAYWLKRELQGRGLSAQIEFGEFSGAAAEAFSLRDAVSGQARVEVLSLCLEMHPGYGSSGWDPEAACQNILALVEAAVAGSVSPVVINSVLAPLRAPHGVAVVPTGQDSALAVDRLNVELRQLAGRNPGRVVLLDWCAYARELGEAATYDYRYWKGSAAPFAAQFLKRYARDLAVAVEGFHGRPRKCLVLDCDNTLWGGVVGELGLEGVALSGDQAPGHYYQEFQQSVLDLQRQGVLITLCSKNNEADVLEVLDKHPSCLIRREHLAAWRIAWTDKADGIVELAEELNIGLDSFVFVDDSPIECERVRTALPGVWVIQAPSRPEEHAQLLRRTQPFAAVVVTSEDRIRTQAYRQERERKSLRSSLVDLNSYRASLETRLVARVANPGDLERVAQLSQRTNQFNLVPDRMDVARLQRMAMDEGRLVLCAEVSDRFGDLGVVGAATLARRGDVAVVETFMMSCRALSRDAEFAFAAFLAAKVLDEWGVRAMAARFVPGPKNALVADFWSRTGMTQVAESEDGCRDYLCEDMLAFIAANSVPHVELSE